MGAQAWPFGGLCPGPDGLGFGTGAQPRLEAPWIWRHGMARG